MKTIRKNYLLLAFAAGALFLIGNNVMADPTTPIVDPGPEVPIYNCPGGAIECIRITSGNTVHIFYKNQH